MEQLPRAWREFLGGELDSAGLDAILDRVTAERAAGAQVFPPEGRLFHAFELTPPERVRAVLLGQDPYHDDGQAEGLAFSVPAGVKFPPSLRNIFKEYAADLGRPVPGSGSLRNWAAGGVLLLNSVLSVRAHEAGSHRKFGWEHFTDSVIRALNRKNEPVAFLLWGNFALAKRPLIDETRHAVLPNVHPSPLSAHRGFFGSRPFSQAERTLPGWTWPEL
ncbi:Uracil-DNA glycosylase [bioreactor metagenome]|uniref:Uracil-DNA glycosylase n=1 Tax=bioreactor metagenome TaxID=1076179 RepID=A0A645G5K8_9ZZZZ